MKNNKNAPKSLGALFNKSDTIIAILLTSIIGFLWFETTKFEKVPDLFSNNIPPEMFPQILLIIIFGMVLIVSSSLFIFVREAVRKKPLAVKTSLRT